MNQKKFDSFHDSQWGDIFDLYNACNGVLHKGLLDIRKLDELNEEEVEVLDVPRLREIWQHSATGCVQCEVIITKLNSARKPARKPTVESKTEPAPVATATYGDPRWES